jgi:hypothetical protein
MSTSSQEPMLPIDMNTEVTERTPLPGTGSGACRPAPSRAARLRAIHDLVRSNGYHVPAGLVAERMLEQADGGKRDSQD